MGVHMTDVGGIGGFKNYPTLGGPVKSTTPNTVTSEVRSDGFEASSLPPEYRFHVKSARMESGSEVRAAEAKELISKIKAESQETNRLELAGDFNTGDETGPATLQEFLQAQNDKLAAGPTVYLPSSSNRSLVPSSLMMDEVSLHPNAECTLEQSFAQLLKSGTLVDTLKSPLEGCLMAPEISWQLASPPGTYKAVSEESAHGKGWDYSFPNLTEKSPTSNDKGLEACLMSPELSSQPITSPSYVVSSEESKAGQGWSYESYPK
jgi:hypothetical protein